MTSPVFLDLDGTLTDPKPGITGGIAHALTALGLAVPEDLTWAIGPPLDDSFAKLGAPDPAEALRIYREIYGTEGLFQAELYPGIPEALSALGGPLYLATAKPHAFARKITAHFGLDRHLADQFGPELDGTRNDKADLLAYACARLGLDPKGCIMVGDRGMDQRAARRNGMAFIGVTWGYAQPGELDAADAIIDAPSELPAAIARLSAEG